MKIGSYIWEKGVPVYDSDLVSYFHACVDSVLKSPKWWKQEHALKKIKVTIEVQD